MAILHYHNRKGDQHSVGENDSLLIIGIFAMLVSVIVEGGLNGSQNCNR